MKYLKSLSDFLLNQFNETNGYMHPFTGDKSKLGDIENSSIDNDLTAEKFEENENEGEVKEIEKEEEKE